MEIETRESEPEKYRNAWNVISLAEGILVPGGFGQRGTEGKIAAVRWARENKIPYLGKYFFCKQTSSMSINIDLYLQVSA